MGGFAEGRRMKRGQRRRGEAMEDDRSWGGKRRWQMQLQKNERGGERGESDGGRQRLWIRREGWGEGVRREGLEIRVGEGTSSQLPLNSATPFHNETSRHSVTWVCFRMHTPVALFLSAPLLGITRGAQVALCTSPRCKCSPVSFVSLCRTTRVRC